MRNDIATVAELEHFDALLDVRSPAEFALDHLPGAINTPVLDDAERARVGTMYVQEAPFLARKVGAALVARNIARHIDEQFAAHERGWKPLVYCWRGGMRSGSMTTILRAIGWDARQLDGGYRTFRRHVVAELEVLPARLSFRVVCGPTGSGKTRLIGALAAAGCQVLDLESIAAHRGSLLGGWPDRPQPSQKAFETRLWEAIRRLDPARPVYVEAESRKIGDLRVPEALMDHMRAADCVRLDTPDAARVALLMQEYAHYFDEPAVLIDKLKALTALHGHARIDAWVQDAEAGRWEALVAALLEEHYDPAYAKSAAGHFPGLANATHVALPDTSDAALGQAAAALANPDRISTRPETADRSRVSSAPTTNLINEEVQPLRLQMTATSTRLSDKNATPESRPGSPSSPTLPEGEGSRRHATIKPPSSPAVLPGGEGSRRHATPEFPSSQGLLPAGEGSRRHATIKLPSSPALPEEEGSRRHPSPSGRGTEGEGR